MDKLWNASSIFEAGLEIFSTVNINVPWRVCNRKSRDGNIFFGRTFCIPPFVVRGVRYHARPELLPTSALCSTYIT